MVFVVKSKGGFSISTEYAENIAKEAKNALYRGDAQAAAGVARRALEDNIDLAAALAGGFCDGMQEAGARFERGELSLDALIRAAAVMAGAAVVIEAALEADGSSER